MQTRIQARQIKQLLSDVTQTSDWVNIPYGPTFAAVKNRFENIPDDKVLDSADLDYLGTFLHYRWQAIIQQARQAEQQARQAEQKAKQAEQKAKQAEQKAKQDEQKAALAEQDKLLCVYLRPVKTKSVDEFCQNLAKALDENYLKKLMPTVQTQILYTTAENRTIQLKTDTTLIMQEKIWSVSPSELVIDELPNGNHLLLHAADIFGYYPETGMLTNPYTNDPLAPKTICQFESSTPDVKDEYKHIQEDEKENIKYAWVSQETLNQLRILDAAYDNASGSSPYAEEQMRKAEKAIAAFQAYFESLNPCERAALNGIHVLCKVDEDRYLMLSLGAHLKHIVKGQTCITHYFKQYTLHHSILPTLERLLKKSKQMELKDAHAYYFRNKKGYSPCLLECIADLEKERKEPIPYGALPRYHHHIHALNSALINLLKETEEPQSKKLFTFLKKMQTIRKELKEDKIIQSYTDVSQLLDTLDNKVLIKIMPQYQLTPPPSEAKTAPNVDTILTHLVQSLERKFPEEKEEELKVSHDTVQWFSPETVNRLSSLVNFGDVARKSAVQTKDAIVQASKENNAEVQKAKQAIANFLAYYANLNELEKSALNSLEHKFQITDDKHERLPLITYLKRIQNGKLYVTSWTKPAFEAIINQIKKKKTLPLDLEKINKHFKAYAAPLVTSITQVQKKEKGRPIPHEKIGRYIHYIEHLNKIVAPLYPQNTPIAPPTSLLETKDTPILTAKERKKLNPEAQQKELTRRTAQLKVNREIFSKFKPSLSADPKLLLSCLQGMLDMLNNMKEDKILNKFNGSFVCLRKFLARDESHTLKVVKEICYRTLLKIMHDFNLRLPLKYNTLPSTFFHNKHFERPDEKQMNIENLEDLLTGLIARLSKEQSPKQATPAPGSTLSLRSNA